MRHTLPLELIKAFLRRKQRQQHRAFKRDTRHAFYAAGGKTHHARERARRVRQIMTGRLTVANGLVIS